MTDHPNIFRPIAVPRQTKRKIVILAKILDNGPVYSIVQRWAEKEWNEALKAGLVNNSMLKEKDKAS